MSSRSLLLPLLSALLLGPATAQASDAPEQCTTNGGSWTVVAGDTFPAQCAAASCTGISYTILRNTNLVPDHVALLVDHDAAVVVPASRDVAAPCAGDAGTQLGTRDCSSRAVRVNQNSETSTFDLVVEGDLIPVGSSIVVKKGKIVEQCRIATLGSQNFYFDAKAQVATQQTFDFEGCQVTIPTSVETGEGGAATITGQGCAFVANGLPAGIAKLIVDDKDVGFLSYGTGYISSGSDSCTTRVISNRIYTWCTCADTNGDGRPDDPSPPC
jgi:hypothetical protein